MIKISILSGLVHRQAKDYMLYTEILCPIGHDPDHDNLNEFIYVETSRILNIEQDLDNAVEDSSKDFQASLHHTSMTFHSKIFLRILFLVMRENW